VKWVEMKISNRNVLRVVIAILLAVIIVGYMPILLRLIYHAVGMEPQSVGGVKIVMSNEWFPVLDSQTRIGKALVDLKRPTIVFVKPRKFLPGVGDYLVISRDVTPWSDPNNRVVAFTKRYPWGEVRFIKGAVTGSEDEHFAYISLFGLNLSSANRESLDQALDDIKEVALVRK
jgi:hypothetical protein